MRETNDPSAAADGNRADHPDHPDHPRAEELILDTYRQRSDIARAGGNPSLVVMSRSYYEIIQRYHALLGEAPDESADYIGRYRLFDLEICLEEVDRIRVE